MKEAGVYDESKYYIGFDRRVVGPGYYNQYLMGIRDELFKNRINGENFLGHASPEFVAMDLKKHKMHTLVPLYTILHESTHLAQDYQLGALYLKDFLGDCGYLAGALNAIGLNQKKKRATIFPLQEYEGWDVELKRNWCEAYYGIFGYTLRYTLPNNQTIHELTMNNLLEGYAYAKTFYLLTHYDDICISDKGEVRAQFQTEHMTYHPSNSNRLYRKPWDIFKLMLNFDAETEMIAFVYLCDIALNIPDPETIKRYVEEKGMTYEEFSPAYRYYKCIQTIHRNRGFPDKEENIPVYQTVFDLIARENHWPGFSETVGSWMRFYEARMAYNLMISDTYKYSALLYRLQQYDLAVIEDPSHFFRTIGLPVLIKYVHTYKADGGNIGVSVECCQNVANYSFPSSNNDDSYFLDPSYIMRTGYNEYDYQRFKKEMVEEPILCCLSMKPIYLRELMCRLIAKEFSKAAYECSVYRCPLVEWGCGRQTEDCKHLTSFLHLSNDCGLKIWLDDHKIDRSLIAWKG